MSLIQKLKSWWTASNQAKPYPFSEGQKVEYLGVVWTVINLWHVDSMNNGIILRRINRNDEIESVRLDYFTKLINPIQ